MANSFVNLILDLYDGTETPITQGTVTFTPTYLVTDTTDHLTIPRAPVRVNLFGNPTPTVRLLATDNSAPSPSGWAWQISGTYPGAPPANQYLIAYANGSTQHLSDLMPTVTAPVVYAPVTVSGTPTAGQVITAVSGIVADWQTPDFDASGAAAAAQAAAQAFATSTVGTETSRATTAEALLAPKASPAFSGTPTAPTASAGTNTTQVATTAFVGAAQVQAANSATISTSTANISLATGLTQSVTLTENCTFTFTNWPAGASQVTVVVIENTPGGWIPTFSGVTWIGNQPAQNTGAGQISVYCFLSPNAGTTVYGAGTVNSCQGLSGVDIFDWLDSAGSLVAYLDSTGRAHFPEGVVAGTNTFAGTALFGSNGNQVINAQDGLSSGAAEVNYVNFANAATGSGPTISPGSAGTAPDANVDMNLAGLGTGVVGLTNATTVTTAPGAGGAGALPATPAGYVTIKVNGTARKVAYY